jgi:LacI family transcriptional regulator
MEIAARAIEIAFEGGWKPSGPIVCASDMVAIVLMDMLSERGYKAGSEIPILGFDDHELSRDVGLTTMRPPMRAMGAEAARLLLAGPEGQLNGCQIRLCSQLIPRSSTMANPRPVRNPLSQTAFRATPEVAAV